MRRVSRIVVMLCALGSLACTLYAGHRNRSILLVAMFAIWVVAPFVGMLGAMHWVEGAQAQTAPLLGAITLLFSVGALGLYAVLTLFPQGHHAAAPFLIVPICQWVAMTGLLVSVRRRRAPGAI